MSFLRTLWRRFKEHCINIALICVSLFVAGCGVFIVTLYLLQYVNTESAEMIKFKCHILRIEHPSCPDFKEELRQLREDKRLLEEESAVLQAEKSALEERKTEWESELSVLRDEKSALEEAKEKLQNNFDNLVKIENSIDTVTLFSMHVIPKTQLTVAVGTNYSRLTEPTLDPKYYCYIEFPGRAGHEYRNLYIYSYGIDIALDADTLAKNGVSDAALKFAKSKCKPYLIGEAK